MEKLKMIAYQVIKYGVKWRYSEIFANMVTKKL